MSEQFIPSEGDICEQHGIRFVVTKVDRDAGKFFLHAPPNDEQKFAIESIPKWNSVIWHRKEREAIASSGGVEQTSPSAALRKEYNMGQHHYECPCGISKVDCTYHAPTF